MFLQAKNKFVKQYFVVEKLFTMHVNGPGTGKKFVMKKIHYTEVHYMELQLYVLSFQRFSESPLRLTEFELDSLRSTAIDLEK